MALAVPSRHQPNLRRQALAQIVAWDDARGVHIVRFPLRPRVVFGRDQAQAAVVQARYQAQFDRPAAPIRWLPTRLEARLIRLANRVRQALGLRT
jgi:hypothetical protein